MANEIFLRVEKSAKIYACIARPIFTQQFCGRLIIGFSIKMCGTVKGHIIWDRENLPPS